MIGFLSLSWNVFGASQKYVFSDPKLDDEMGNIYKYLNAAIIPPSFTKAQLQAMTPKRAGLPFYCSDCATDGIVVSTGAVLGGFGRISARTTAIN